MAVTVSIQNPINQVQFQANWNSSNIHLHSNVVEIWKQSEEPFLQKVYLCFTKVLDWIAHLVLKPAKHMCRSMVLPISNVPEAARAEVDRQWTEFWSGQGGHSPWIPLRNTYQASELNVTAPDGTEVKGAFYQHQRGVGQDVPTIICFSPNAQLAKSECWNWLLKKGITSPIPFNVVVFDYRYGSDLTDADQCVLDGDAIVQAVHQRMGVSKNNIHMMGYSYGGGISALVRGMHQDAGNYVNLRSFGSISHVIQHSSIINQFLPAGLRSGWIADIVKAILGQLVGGIKWEIDVKQSIQSMGDRALVVYHPDDPIIPGAASPAEWVDASRAVEMRFKETVRNAPDNFDHHCAPLKYYQDANGLNVSKRILNALLGTDVFQRRRPVENRMHYDLRGV